MYVHRNLIIWSLVLIGPAVCPRLWSSKTESSPHDSTKGSTHHSTKGSTHHSTKGSTHDSTKGSTHDSTKGSTYDSTNGLTKDSTNHSTNLCAGASFSPEPETEHECTKECESKCGRVIREGHPPVPIKTGVFEKKSGKRVCKCQFSRALYSLIEERGRNEEDFKKHEHNIKEARAWLKQNGFRTKRVSFSEDTLPSKSDGDPVMTPESCKSKCRRSRGCVMDGPEWKAIAEGNATPSKDGWECKCKMNLAVGKIVKAAGLSVEEFFKEFEKGGSACCKWLRDNEEFKPKVSCPDDSPEHAENAKPSSELKLQRPPTKKTLRRMLAIQREDEQPSSSGRDSKGTRSPSPSKQRRGADNED
nr:PREDICTED: uncharacterized protein LOC109044686 [Bemisia tabaci]